MGEKGLGTTPIVSCIQTKNKCIKYTVSPKNPSNLLGSLTIFPIKKKILLYFAPNIYLFG